MGVPSAAMTKARLPQAPDAPDDGAPLGRDTIMDRGLALRYGADYVHLVAFAIDVDRIREALEEDDPEYDEGEGAWPFAWETFLTEAYLVAHLDPADPRHVDLVSETVDAILEAGPGEILGGQLVFAVWHAVERRAWSPETGRVFRTWKRRPDGLARQLAPLWADADALRRDLAEACLEAPLEPPLVAPVREALARWAR